MINIPDRVGNIDHGTERSANFSVIQRLLAYRFLENHRG